MVARQLNPHGLSSARLAAIARRTALRAIGRPCYALFHEIRVLRWRARNDRVLQELLENAGSVVFLGRPFLPMFCFHVETQSSGLRGPGITASPAKRAVLSGFGRAGGQV